MGVTPRVRVHVVFAHRKLVKPPSSVVDAIQDDIVLLHDRRQELHGRHAREEHRLVNQVEGRAHAIRPGGATIGAMPQGMVIEQC